MGSIGVGELESMSFYQIRNVPSVMGNFAVPLKELPRRVDDRSLHITPPAVSASVALSALLLAFLSSRCVNFFGVGVIDYSDGVAA